MMIEMIRDMSLSYCTLGRIIINGKTFFTIERPWIPDAQAIGGRKGVSCIPLGEYRLDRHNGEAFQKVWALVNPSLGVYHLPQDVPTLQKPFARTACLIHPANFAHELRGCIAPGKNRAQDGAKQWMVSRSRDAVNEIRTLIGSALDVRITITDFQQRKTNELRIP
ncbi:hypothetical protein UFOVP1082_36 [uncultured Caudovirales phage]|uniref:DUF5675 domain-containing protein n=1 Tax=uncultured Caudovirales phage TaxID=2100421 RepID=A0A6J5SFJ9_9CAUD|nr:hypothetical protein UFOVP906_14 [uncultured Caudovirales phage]CAB4176541.1 hypothetical protein UFOVP992_40 [uncultured Caudovirales phage]CAB4183393.1 hypothetical protein UFOVP1082_36 [uncultured Caudovirales phage]CAB4197418.1 hypothetical protein UFOVP1322_21 [uncultured Caudovirales phage]CAB4212803.1 hypothetical protein UFOVP1434_43 [uncultured Caudovirales phage]